MNQLLSTIAVLSVLLTLIPFSIHIKEYKILIRSLKERGMDISTLSLEFENYGSSGVIKKLKLLEKGFVSTGLLNPSELNHYKNSKQAYYWQAPLVSIFIISLFSQIFIRL